MILLKTSTRKSSRNHEIIKGELCLQTSSMVKYASYPPDIDECSNSNGGCDGQCITYASYPPDIDECSNSNGGCDGQCINLPGSFYCQCPRGFRVTLNDKTCAGKDKLQLRYLNPAPVDRTSASAWFYKHPLYCVHKLNVSTVHL